MSGQPTTQTQRAAEAYRRGVMSPALRSQYEDQVRRGLVDDPYALARIQEHNDPIMRGIAAPLLGSSAGSLAGRLEGTALGGAQRVVNGVPFLPELGAGFSAGLRTIDDLGSGRPVDFGKRWDEARAQQQGYADQFQQDHPVTGNLLGAAGMVAPSAAAAKLAPMVGPGVAPAAARLGKALRLPMPKVPVPSLSAPPPGSGVVPVLQAAAKGAMRDGVAGGLVGGAYGFSQPGTLKQRIGNADNAFLPGVVSGAAAPYAAAGVKAIASAPRVGVAVRRALGGDPVSRTLDDLVQLTGVHPDAALGDTSPMAQEARATYQGLWDYARRFSAPRDNEIFDLMHRPFARHAMVLAENRLDGTGRIAVDREPSANTYPNPMRFHGKIAGSNKPALVRYNTLNENWRPTRLPTIDGLDTARQVVQDHLWKRFGADGRLDLDSDGPDNNRQFVLKNLNDLSAALSSGVDVAGQSYRRAFGATGDELSTKAAFQAAQGKVLDPRLDPEDYADWFNGLQPFEQRAARAAAANDILHAVDNGQFNPFASPVVQRRMAAVFDPVVTAEPEAANDNFRTGIIRKPWTTVTAYDPARRARPLVSDAARHEMAGEPGGLPSPAEPDSNIIDMNIPFREWPPADDEFDEPRWAANPTQPVTADLLNRLRQESIASSLGMAPRGMAAPAGGIGRRLQPTAPGVASMMGAYDTTPNAFVPRPPPGASWFPSIWAASAGRQNQDPQYEGP